LFIHRDFRLRVVFDFEIRNNFSNKDRETGRGDDMTRDRTKRGGIGDFIKGHTNRGMIRGERGGQGKGKNRGRERDREEEARRILDINPIDARNRGNVILENTMSRIRARNKSKVRE